MQSTYVLQGLHLHIPNIFPDYPGNSSVALGAQNSGYKVRDNWRGQPPSSSQAEGFLLEEEAEMKLPLHSPCPMAGCPRGTGKAPGGWADLCLSPATLPRCSTAQRNSGQLLSHPLLLRAGGSGWLTPGLQVRCTLLTLPCLVLLRDPCLLPGLSKAVSWHFRGS